MFNKCHKLKEIIGINNFNTINVNDMKALFQECNSLEYLNLTNFSTNNVTIMSFMFRECYKLKIIEGITNFNTTHVNEMEFMFKDCNSLENLDLSYLNIPNNSYKELLSQLNEQINNNLKINDENNLNNKMNIIIFISLNETFNISLVFDSSDIFSKLEEKLYAKYPSLKNKNISFFVDEKEINKTGTFEENEIKNGDSITIKEMD